MVAEQGLGEEILASSMFEDVRHGGASLLVICDQRLVGIFARSFPGSQFVGRQSLRRGFLNTIGIDYWIHGMSLGKYLRNGPEKFLRPKGYLSTDPELSNRYRRLYAQLAGDNLKVGICFLSEKSHFSRKKTPPFEYWLELCSLPGLFLVNLQHGERWRALEEQFQAKSLALYRSPDIDPKNDLDALAAQIENLDVVVSVSNTTAHLASAIGCRTFVLVPWRIGLLWTLPHARTSLWYARTTFFRQTPEGDWSPGFASVRKALQRLLSLGAGMRCRSQSGAANV